MCWACGQLNNSPKRTQALLSGVCVTFLISIDIIKSMALGLAGWALHGITSVLLRGRLRGQQQQKAIWQQSEMPWWQLWGWRKGAVSQGVQSQMQEAGLSESLPGRWLCCPLWFWPSKTHFKLLASRTVREWMYVVSSNWVVLICCSRHRGLTIACGKPLGEVKWSQSPQAGCVLASKSLHFFPNSSSQALLPSATLLA